MNEKSMPSKVKVQVLAKGVSVLQKPQQLAGSVTERGCGGAGECLVISPDLN